MASGLPDHSPMACRTSTCNAMTLPPTSSLRQQAFSILSAAYDTPHASHVPKIQQFLSARECSTCYQCLCLGAMWAKVAGRRLGNPSDEKRRSAACRRERGACRTGGIEMIQGVLMYPLADTEPLARPDCLSTHGRICKRDSIRMALGCSVSARRCSASVESCSPRATCLSPAAHMIFCPLFQLSTPISGEQRRVPCT